MNARTPRERFSDKQQKKLIMKADEYFGLDKLPRKKAVIFEFGPVKEINTGVFNSGKKEEIDEAIAKGNIIIANHDLVEGMSEDHWRFLMAMHEGGMRVPLTLIRINHPAIGNTVMPIGSEMPAQSALWVHKLKFDEAGNYYGHRGEGISFVKVENIRDADRIMPKHMGEFYQQLVVPPDDYIRDVRVYVAGNKIVPGYIRKAIKPLTKGNYSGLFLPTRDQFVTAEHPGEILPIEGELKSKVVAEAQKAREILVNRIKQRRKDLVGQDLFAFGSIDFLLDAKGEPVINEFDVSPTIRNDFNLPEKLAREMSEYLIEKAGKNKAIHVYGYSEHPFIRALVQLLKKKLPANRVIRKEPLHTTV